MSYKSRMQIIHILMTLIFSLKTSKSHNHMISFREAKEGPFSQSFDQWKNVCFQRNVQYVKGQVKDVFAMSYKIQIIPVLIAVICSFENKHTKQISTSYDFYCALLLATYMNCFLYFKKPLRIFKTKS